METKTIPIHAIIVPKKRYRPYDEAQVGFLLESIKREGLRTPITVRLGKKTGRGRQYMLVAGNYRLQAMRLLGETVIAAIIIDKKESKRWELIENFSRVDLTHLQKAEHLVQYICLVEDCAPSDLSGTEFKISAASRKLDLPGLTKEARRKTLERAMNIASIHSEAKEALREAELDNHQAHLLAVAKELTLEDQLKKIADLQSAKASKPKTASDAKAKPKMSAQRRKLRLVKTFEHLEEKMQDGGVVFATGGDILVMPPVAR